MHHFVIATAGHVDHGKSALVEALTGTHPDRLPEEKLRGITIQLGFAHLTIPATERHPDLHLGVVDVPGHEDFVKNMVAGVGAIDLALLVVAADDGWMPQTEEHLQILTYLGVTRAVVALTKIDLAASAEDAAVAAVRAKLVGTPFAEAPIVATSVLARQGLEELREALATVLATTPPQTDAGKPRLPIDRVFTLRGIGAVVTGTLSGGTLRTGQTVALQPSGQTARIRALQNHNAEVELAVPGMRTALNLPSISAHREDGAHGSGMERGDVVTVPELGPAHDTADVVLERASRLIDPRREGVAPLKDGKRVRIHHGSGNFPARLIMTVPELRAGERSIAQLQFEAPLFAFAGDRFIVRDWSEQRTLAGGIILDPEASRRSFRSARQQKFLQARAARAELPVLVLSQLARDGVALRGGLLKKSRFSATDIAQTIATLAEEGLLTIRGELVADADRWREFLGVAGEAVDAWHRAHPDQAGLPLNELRAGLERDGQPPGVFDEILAELGGGDFQQSGTALRRRSHRPALPPQLQAAGDQVRAALAAKPLEPPARKELSSTSAAQQALRFLIQTGEAVEIAADLVMLAESFARAREMVLAHLRAKRSASASELRQAVGTNRRVIIPLLEYFDRTGVTVRQGSERTTAH